MEKETKNDSNGNEISLTSKKSHLQVRFQFIYF